MFSQFSQDLNCVHCGKANAAKHWPERGDSVAFYYQKKPGDYQVTVHCSHCGKDWYVVWDEFPGLGCDATAPSSASPSPGSVTSHPIRFDCPGCDNHLKAAPRAAGKRAKCPACGIQVTVPAAPIDSSPSVVRQPHAPPSSKDISVVQTQKNRVQQGAGPADEDALIDQLIRWVRSDATGGFRERDRVRQIGAMLDLKGGIELMRLAHQRVRNQGIHFSQVIWDGIGEWRA